MKIYYLFFKFIQYTSACIFPIDVQYDAESRIYTLYTDDKDILDTITNKSKNK